MLFQSWQFVLFCSMTLALYWTLDTKVKNWQNSVLLLSGYFFYGYWKITFPLVLFGSSSINYALAFYGNMYGAYKTALLRIGIIFNLCLLGSFKYVNFFTDSLCHTLQLAAIDCNITLIKVIVPLGISFYTFQAISFLVDSYKGKLPMPTMLSFFAMQAFFPHILSGPIANATKMLPQFGKTRTMNLDMCLDAVGQILWGIFKKNIVADNLVKVVSYYFIQHGKLSGSDLLLGAIFYSFQLYADFSGYSDMAIGIGKLFGIDISQNFNYPNFSRSIGEFWQRWHKTLSAWFKEYVYFPLGGSRGHKGQQVFNAMAVFTLSGLWHGASWNYVLWGFTNGLLFLPKIFQAKSNKSATAYYWSDWFFIPLTLILISLTRIWFRSPDFGSAISYYKGLFSMSFFTIPTYCPWLPIQWILVMTLLEWLNRFQGYGIQFKQLPTTVRISIWIGIAILTYTQTNTQNANEYIYFKF
jgi:alginate O-acetyltransferase complex protein AlgI